MSGRTTIGIVVLIGASIGMNRPSSGEMRYRPGPGISGVAIKQSVGLTWFHLSEGCNLRAKGKDVDQRCDPGGDKQWHDIEDYIDLPNTSWVGAGLQDETGAEVSWDPENPSTDLGWTITATIVDQTSIADANDPDQTATKQMFAYEAIADLDFTSSSITMDTTLTESDQTTGYGHSVVIRHGTHTSGGHFFAFDHAEATNEFAAAKWTLRTNPATAVLGAGGKLKVPVRGVSSIDTYVDINDQGGPSGDFPIAVAFGVQRHGIGASVNFEFNIPVGVGDAAAAVAFDFTSDDLTNDSQKLTLNSEEDEHLPGSAVGNPERGLLEKTMGIEQDDIFTGIKDAISRSKMVVKVEGDAQFTHTGYRASALGYLNYTIGTPYYKKGLPQDPEEGY